MHLFTHCCMCKMQNSPRENRQTVLAANSIVVFMLPDNKYQDA